MSKAEDRAQTAYPRIIESSYGFREDIYEYHRKAYIEGYRQAEKDIKEELSNLFQEFMMDCINDNTDTHILHFIDVFNNKIKTIGNE